MPDFENDPTITHLLKSVGLDLRRQELLATLSEADVQRVTRFGEKRSYRDGQLMFEAGNRQLPAKIKSKGVIACRSLRTPVFRSRSGWCLAFASRFWQRAS